MNVLVTGGAGYVGSVLVPELLNSGHRVRVLDMIRSPVAETILGDVSDPAVQAEAVKFMGAVVHLAAVVKVGGETAEDAQRIWTVNARATRDLVAVARSAGVSRFILVSTCGLYGMSEVPADEQQPVAPTSIYALSKLEAESAVLRVNGRAFHPTVLRLATAFGGSPRISFVPLLNALIHDALTTGRIHLYGPHSARTFVHVKDVARAIALVLTTPPGRVSGEIFNVGAEHLTHTKMEIATLLRQMLPRLTVDVGGEQDARSYRVSFRKIASLGFRVNHTLGEGIREIVDALQAANS